ncbi:MAG: glycosyltransferase family 4 protein [Candidatus Zixiibacteriota bacterium]|nr:MAG: glycosyltransferase family 4 protein [candidate division Zixibacteria bacterium]
MILFLTDRAEGTRGGEEDNARLFSFFRENYEDVYPERLTKVTGDLKSPWKHAKYKLNLVRKYSPDLTIVDISAATRNFLAIRWLKKRQKKIMTVFLGRRMTFRYNNRLLEKTVRFCEAYTLANSDIICVNSEYTAGLIGGKARRRAKIIIARPGTSPISTDIEKIDTGSRNRQRPLILLFVGACTKVKGLKYLAEALTKIRWLDFRLRVAGEYNIGGAYYRKVNKIIEDGGIADKVDFSGFVRAGRLSEFYRSSSIYVLPSLSEGYGRSLIEALSFGLPIIASNTGAIPELVKDGENAILVEPKNPEALAEAIMRLASDPEKMDGMNRANFEKARNAQTWDMFSKELKTKLVPAIVELSGIYPTEKRQGRGNSSK